MTWTAVVWKAPAKLFFLGLRPGWLTPKRGMDTEEYLLALRLTWSRQNFVGSFNLCNLAREKASSRSLFLPEG